MLLDGATGTELERRGVPMVEGAWCGFANFTHPDIVRRVHEDYVRLGCDVIIANSFATTRHMLEAAGAGDRAAEACRLAVRPAKEAVARDRPVAVSGSLSTAGPRVAPEREAANDREAAEALADAGADLIILEWICDIERGKRAFEAARATGLTIWVGLSVRRREDGKRTSFRYEEPSAAELVRHWARAPVEALGIMHSSLSDTDLALPLVREAWAGPILVYPQQGWFEPPHWHFLELRPDDFADAAARWIEAGARIVGGCCGIGPEHIEALARRVGRLSAS